MLAKVCLALLALCIAGALAQNNYCCTVNQWKADARGIARAHGGPKNETVGELFYEVVYYDFDNHQMRFDVLGDVFGINRHHIALTVIEKMVKGRWERFLIHPDGRCERRDPKIAFMEQACVKDGYTHKWEYTLGETLAVEAFIHEPRRDVFTEMAVSKHHCVPIHGSFHARHNTDRAGSFISWHNFVPRLDDPFIFNLPSSCSQ